MRILITGGAGFIGSHLAAALLLKGHHVCVIDNLSTGKIDNLPAAVDLHQADLTAAATIPIIHHFAPEVIFHLAAQISIRNACRDPHQDAQNNILGTINVLTAAQIAKTRLFVFASTGGAIYGDSDNLPSSENQRPAPRSAYGVSKLCAEHYCRYFAQQNKMRWAALRYSNVYGPRQNPHGEAGVVAIFSRKLLQDQAITIYGNGQQTRDFIYVSDVIDANLAILQKDKAQGLFNIGTGVETSVLELQQLLTQLLRKSSRITQEDQRSGEQQRSAIANFKAFRLLNWRPQVDLETGLKYTLKWLTEHD